MRKPSLALALLAGLCAAAFSQPQGTNGTSDSPPAMPSNLKPLPQSKIGEATANSFKVIDQQIKDLADTVQRFQDCIDGIAYLKKDLATTKAKLTRAGGGKIPSSQSTLVVLKMKRLGRQRETCVEMIKDLDARFTNMMRALSGIEPRNHPGIPSRRNKIIGLREKFNNAQKTFGRGKNGDAAGGESSAEDAGSEDSAQ